MHPKTISGLLAPNYILPRNLKSYALVVKTKKTRPRKVFAEYSTFNENYKGIIPSIISMLVHQVFSEFIDTSSISIYEVADESDLEVIFPELLTNYDSWMMPQWENLSLIYKWVEYCRDHDRPSNLGLNNPLTTNYYIT